MASTAALFTPAYARFPMNASEYLSVVQGHHEEARRRGVLFRAAEDGGALHGRGVRLDGRDVCSFASCSYLGLEFHPALVEGAADAARRWGTQFSTSRGYLAAPPCAELEDRLSALFGGWALVASSTSLGHQMVLPVLATERDAVVLDNQAHRSLQVAATLAQAAGATVETVRHRELDERAVEAVARLARRHRTVWFACDGIYSMYGDGAPFGILRRILDAAPNVRLYVDDAHGMSWAGEHGRGYFLSRFPLSGRVVLGTSLSKAFAAGGACFVFASREERERVRLCGGPYVFSGPMQPPMMGAALASAGIHLSDELAGLQRTYRERVELCHALLAEHGLPLLSDTGGPILFLPVGPADAAMTLSQRMMDEGYFVTIASYPSVPQRRAGIRLTLTALHTPAEVRGVVEALARHLPRVAAEHGVTDASLAELFADAVPAESRRGMRLRLPSLPAAGAAPAPATRPGAQGADGALPRGWTVEVLDTADALDAAEWDARMGGRGASSREALRLAERFFRGRGVPEEEWTFRYVVVRGPGGAPLAMTYFTRCLFKDDMFMREEVSREVERLRREDPYLLTSTVLMLGSMLSEGDHLWTDRAGPWREAMEALHGVLMRHAEAWGVSSVVLRDLPGDDAEMDAWMRARDYVKAPQPDTHRLAAEGAAGLERRMRTAGRQTRRVLRGLEEAAPAYRVRVFGVHGEPLDEGLAGHLYGLYRDVAGRKLRINTFPLPADLVPALAACPAWELVALALDGAPVAWYAAHRAPGHYAAFLCGVDRRHVDGREDGAYRQMLRAMALRAAELGAHTLHWGMDAETEKLRFGAVAHPTCAYVLVRDHDHGERLEEVARAVGLGG